MRVGERHGEDIRESLKAGAVARAEEDIEMAEEFFPAEEEVWDGQHWGQAVMRYWRKEVSGNGAGRG